MTRTQRDPVIVSGMPGSSCQMHNQIVVEIMKNLQRKKQLEPSPSNDINKWRFKLPSEFPDEAKSRASEQIKQIIDLERQMVQNGQIQADPQISA